MKKVVISGPTGAIGHALIQECLDHGDEVYAICHPGSKRVSTLPQNEHVHICFADLSNLLALKDELPHNCDVFYHYAWAGTFGDARNDMYLQHKNIGYALDAVKLAHECGCQIFIGAGSQAEYGRFEGKLRPDTPAFPENGYGMAKLCAGEMTRYLAQSLGMKHIWPRILSVYGPYDGMKTMVMSTIVKLLHGEKPAFTAGEQMWDYLYTGDVGGIMYALSSEKSKDGAIYCLGTGIARPLKDYIIAILDHINPELPLGIGEIPYSPKQVMYLCADTRALIDDLGYHFKYSFDDGIAKTIEWVREQERIFS